MGALSGRHERPLEFELLIGSGRDGDRSKWRETESAEDSQRHIEYAPN